MGKSMILFATIFLSVYITEQADFLSKERIDYINRVATTWKAKENFPPDTPKEQIIRLLGSKKVKDISSRHIKEDDPMYVNDNKIPDTFDARTHWPKCTTIGIIPNQGNCGSSAAISTSGAFADRLCIKTKGHFNKLLSVEDVAFCCTLCGDGCNGVDPLEAWKFFNTDGIVTGGNYNSSEGCQPYTIPPCIQFNNVTGVCDSPPPIPNPVCSKVCYGDTSIDYNKDLHKVKKYYSILPRFMQKEIITYGPIESSIDVYDDFPSYRSGVYKKTKGAKLLGSHSVKIIGWGIENSVPYWLVINPWGVQFGDQGLFKIRRGHDECSIENDCTAGIPYHYL